MKFFMVVIICMGFDCDAVFDQNAYHDKATCDAASHSTRSYMMETFPNSAGEIHCLEQSDFDLYMEFLENGGKPSINQPEQSLNRQEV
jgi:hypothetical protein